MALRLLARGWRNGLAAGALVGLAAVSSAADAETMFGFFSSDVSPAEAMTNVARHGFVMRSAMVRRGDVYVVDVSDHSGQMERLIIDAHTGFIAQRYPSRSGYARRIEPPRYAAPAYGYDAPDEDGFDPPRPLANIPPPRPPVYANSPSDAEQRAIRERQLAYGGDGRGPAATPPALDLKAVDRPRPKIARPKPAASPSLDASAVTPSSTTKDVPPPAAVARPKPAAVKEAPPPKEATVAPTLTTPASEPAKPAATPPKSEGVMASTGAASSPPPPAPTPPPAAKRKAINDIPVTPLD